MPIDVACPGCRKTLRAPDTVAGKRVKCPQCGAAISVPQPVSAPPAAYGGVADLIDEAINEEVTKRRAADEAEYERQQEAAIEKTYNDPKAKAAEKREKGLSRIRPRPLDVGKAFGRAWKTLFANYGFCLGTSILMSLVSSAIIAGSAFATTLIFLFSMRLLEDSEMVLRFVVGTVTFLMSLVLTLIVPSWLQAGLVNCYLKLAKAQPAEFVDLFRGGVSSTVSVLASNVCLAFLWIVPLLGPITIGALIELEVVDPSPYFNYASGAWLFATSVACAYFTFRLAFYAHAIVDLKVGNADAFGLTWSITAGGTVSLFIFMFLMGAISLGGMLFASLGFYLISFPLMQMALAVAYVDMTGQRPRNVD